MAERVIDKQGVNELLNTVDGLIAETDIEKAVHKQVVLSRKRRRAK